MKKIKKGDEVIVIAGKDKGKKGIVLTIIDHGEKLLIEGINIAKKHIKANPNENQPGQIGTKTMPIHRSNVMLYEQNKEKGSRVGIRTLEDGKRVRFYKASDQVIDVKD